MIGLLVPCRMPSICAAAIAFEDGAILGVSDLLRGVLRRLPVGIVRAALDVVDLLAVELERDPEFDQRLDLALPREHALARRGDRLEVAGADRGKAGAARPLDVDHAPSGEVALERALRLLFDLAHAASEIGASSR